MAFQTTNEGVPYHPPVAPDVPTAPRLPQGDMVGSTLINAWVHAALGREQAKLEQEKTLQTADLAARELQHKDQWEQMKYEVDKQNANTMSNYRMDNLDVRRSEASALNDLRGSQKALADEKVKQLQSGVQTATQASLEFARTMRGVHEDFMSRAGDLGVFSAKTQMQDPVGFADAISTLKAEYPNAPTGSGISQQLRTLQAVADKQKTTIYLNGAPKQYTYQQILGGLRNPDTHDEYYQGLVDAGHIKTIQDTGKVKPFSISHPLEGIWDRVTGTTEKKTVIKPGPTQQKILQQEKAFDPTQVQSRLPEDLPRSALDLRAKVLPTPGNINDAATGRVNSSPDLTPEPEPTDTDTIIQQAKWAIDPSNPSRRDPAAVRQALIDQGIDPSGLGE